MHFVGHRVIFKVALCPIQWFTFAVKLVQFRRESGIIPPKHSLTNAVVKPVMENIVKADVFASKGGLALTQIVEARVRSTGVTPLA